MKFIVIVLALVIAMIETRSHSHTSFTEDFCHKRLSISCAHFHRICTWDRKTGKCNLIVAKKNK